MGTKTWLDPKNENIALKQRLTAQMDYQTLMHEERGATIPTLTVENLVVTHGHPPKFSLKNIELKLYPGEIGLIVGRNGSGKSTLLDTVAGIKKPVDGLIKYPGISQNINWKKIRSSIRYLPQKLIGWGPGTLEEAIHLRVLANYKSPHNEEKRCELLIHHYGLSEHRDKTFEQLSAGYQIRAMLALAVATDAKLIILDEPMAHLDVVSQVSFLIFLHDIVKKDQNDIVKKGKIQPAILISSQHVDELELLADKIYFLKDGVMENFEISTEHESFLFETFSNPNNLEFFNEGVDKKIGMSTTDNGVYLLHKMHKKISLDTLVEELSSRGVNIRYIRNLSGSIKSLLNKEEEDG